MAKGKLLVAQFGSTDHPLRIGGVEIPCYVLEDRRRVLVQRKMITAVGISRGSSGGEGGDRLAKFVSGKLLGPFISDELREVTRNPIRFVTPEMRPAYGYEATILADLCEAVLKARDAGALQKQQYHIAAKCELLIRGWARVGIIALVDAATGYEKVRARVELEEILDKFIVKETRPWVKTFPDEFYANIFRLNGWPFAPPFPKKRPQIVGRWTNDLVYSRLAPGVLKKLKEITKKHERMHQHLTENVGVPELKEHFSGIIALQRAAANWRNFYSMVERAYPKFRQAPILPFPEDSLESPVRELPSALADLYIPQE